MLLGLAGFALQADAQDAVAPTPADTPRVSVSGIIFANYQYRIHPAGGDNRFDLDRAYLTASGPLGNRVSFRVTTDVFQQQRDTVNRSWQVRAKYAYGQYDYSRSAAWPAWVRLGILQTVFIEHDESYWPRWLSSSPTDRQGFFSSADAGVSTLIGLPGRRGEIYGTITNGPGFGSREIDRFKDYAARLSLTPFAAQRENPLRTLVFTAWGYKGAVASRFVNGGAEQQGPVGESLRRDRWGVFTAVAHPRVTASVQYAIRTDEGEAGSNTLSDPRIVIDSSGSLTAAYLLVRPFSGMAGRLSLVARLDRVNLNRETGRHHDLVIAGLIWTLSSRAAVALDFQGNYPRAGSATAPLRTVFLHTVARF
ncbi:MAG TPA: hypothetical protein VMM17_01895 [Gemmatimonadaceae bacterium]|nr:hypothetical protein [Gemmatimonadaceae bacterium]